MAAFIVGASLTLYGSMGIAKEIRNIYMIAIKKEGKYSFGRDKFISSAKAISLYSKGVRDGYFWDKFVVTEKEILSNCVYYGEYTNEYYIHFESDYRKAESEWKCRLNVGLPIKVSYSIINELQYIKNNKTGIKYAYTEAGSFVLALLSASLTNRPFLTFSAFFDIFSLLIGLIICLATYDNFEEWVKLRIINYPRYRGYL